MPASIVAKSGMLTEEQAESDNAAKAEAKRVLIRIHPFGSAPHRSARPRRDCGKTRLWQVFGDSPVPNRQKSATPALAERDVPA